MNKDIIIEVKNLHKRFGANEVLRGINTTVSRGEVIAIIGPSGCGKSTFLRSLNLLEQPTDGQVLLDGIDITSKEVNINEMRQRVGMVFQQFNLFPNMTIKRNIMLMNSWRESDWQIRLIVIPMVFRGDRNSVLP